MKELGEETETNESEQEGATEETCLFGSVEGLGDGLHPWESFPQLR